MQLERLTFLLAFFIVQSDKNFEYRFLAEEVSMVVVAEYTAL